jgi:predicted ATPase
LGEEPEEATERLYRQIISRKAPANFESPREYIEGDSSPPTWKSFVGTPLYLYVQMEASGAERLKQQQQQFREVIGREGGQVLSAFGKMLSAVFFNPETAAKAVLTFRDRSRVIDAEVRLVLLAEESNHPQASSKRLVERARELLLCTSPGQLLLDEKAAELFGGLNLPEGMALHPIETQQRGREPVQPLHILESRESTQDSGQTAVPAGSPGNLKALPTTFIGRKRELASVRKMIRSTKVRLVTLTGAAGAGKTRLALQTAAELRDSFEHGQFVVDLAVLNKPEHVLGAVSSALNVREAGDDRQSLLETLTAFLKHKTLLLLMDNFEHLLPAVPQIAQLLAECPRLKILATSREALHIQAERVFPVPPLELPPKGQPPGSMHRSEAMMLFAERANSVQPAFHLDENNAPLVAEICRCLDGLPLAIELAASHMGVLTPHILLTKLKNRLNLLKGGPRDLPERQRTLRSEIDWSYDLLDAEQRQIFMQLSVFSGGCTLDAAEAVFRLPGEEVDVFSVLSSLADKNLIELTGGDGEFRYGMLETIREYARMRLSDCGDPDAVEERFAAYYLGFAEKAEPNLYGREQKWWFGRIEEEYGNIRSALGWLYNCRGLDDGLRLASAMGWFWFRRARFSEGLHWLEMFYNAADESVSPGSRAKTAYYIGWLKLCLSSVWGNPEGKRFFTESLRLWRKTGNRRGVALSQVWLAWKAGDVEDEEGWRIADESVATARETEDPWAIAWCLKVAYSHLRRYDKTLDCRRAALEEAITLARETGDPFLLSQTLNGMGNVFSWIQELEAAEPWYLDSLRIAREIGDSWSILDNIFYLADGNLRLGRLDKAKELLTEGLRLSLEYGARGYLGWFIGGFYNVACSEGRYERAVRLGAFSESILNPGSRYDSSFAQRFNLDDEVAAAEWKIGQTMSAEGAVAFALHEE